MDNHPIYIHKASVFHKARSEILEAFCAIYRVSFASFDRCITVGLRGISSKINFAIFY